MIAGALRLLRYVWNHPLNAAARPAAIGRVLWWQSRARLLRAPRPLPFIDDTRLYATPGAHGVTGNWYCGLHEPAAMAFTLHLLRAGDLFVDVGANLGSYTVLAAGAVGARVIAVEPVPRSFVGLQANVALNDIAARVQCRQVGLSAAPGSLRFSVDRGSANAVVGAGEAGPALDVEVMRLDDLVGDDCPLLVKIDVEGHELPVLRGSTRVLADPRLRALIVETDDQRGAPPGDDAALRSQLEARGFRPVDYDFSARSLCAVGSTQRNTIFVRDEAWVAARLRQAPRFRLVNGTL